MSGSCYAISGISNSIQIIIKMLQKIKSNDQELVVLKITKCTCGEPSEQPVSVLIKLVSTLLVSLLQTIDMIEDINFGFV